MHIFLIRHGESELNSGQNFDIRLPDHLVPLTEKGAEQSRKAGKWLLGYCEEKKVDLSHARMWTSPYLRARQTAAEINGYLRIKDVFEDITLAEQQYGLFDSVPKKDWERLFPVEYAEYTRQCTNNGKFYARLPLGESPFDVAVRIHQFMGSVHRDLEWEGIDTLFVITHGAALRAFLLRWFHYSPEWYQNEDNPKNCWIREIDGNRDCGYINADENS